MIFIIDKSTPKILIIIKNIRVTLSDAKENSTTAVVTSAISYLPFGMVEPNVFTSSGNHRFGYNGQEKSDEIADEGNHNTAEFWEYDTRSGRRWNLDPVKQVSISDYATFKNNPVFYTDLHGDNAKVSLDKKKEGGGTITITSTTYITGKGASQEKADRLNQNVNEIHNAGEFKDKKGNTFTITLKTNFVFVSEPPTKLKADENILEFDNNEDTRSNIPFRITGNQNIKTGKYSNLIITAGQKGTIGKLASTEIEDAVVAHEMLHLYGLSDRYSDASDVETGQLYSIPHKNFENDIMGKSSSRQITQPHFDNWGKSYYNMKGKTTILKNKVDRQKNKLNALIP